MESNFGIKSNFFQYLGHHCGFKQNAFCLQIFQFVSLFSSDLVLFCFCKVRLGFVFDTVLAIYICIRICVFEISIHYIHTSVWIDKGNVRQIHMLYELTFYVCLAHFSCLFASTIFVHHTTLVR